MNKLLLPVALLAATQLTGCFTPSSIEAGEEGVIIKKPWIFGSGGVEPKPITTGLVWTAMSTSVVRYNVKPYKIEECFDDLTTKDNVPVDFCAYITVQLKSGETPVLHEKSGVNWYDNKVKDVFRTTVRNEARSKTSIQLRTDSTVITQSQENVLAEVKAYMQRIDLPVNTVKVIIGKVTPPDEVLKEAARTAAQKQRAKTQEAREDAEKTRKDAEIASANADKAYATQFNMTTEQFLKNKELDIMFKAVENGNTSLIINASQATPVFNVK